jgi:hypothetical protein
LAVKIPLTWCKGCGFEGRKCRLLSPERLYLLFIKRRLLGGGSRGPVAGFGGIGEEIWERWAWLGGLRLGEWVFGIEVVVRDGRWIFRGIVMFVGF